MVSSSTGNGCFYSILGKKNFLVILDIKNEHREKQQLSAFSETEKKRNFQDSQNCPKQEYLSSSWQRYAQHPDAHFGEESATCCLWVFRGHQKHSGHRGCHEAYFQSHNTTEGDDV